MTMTTYIVRRMTGIPDEDWWCVQEAAPPHVDEELVQELCICSREEDAQKIAKALNTLEYIGSGKTP